MLSVFYYGRKYFRSKAKQEVTQMVMISREKLHRERMPKTNGRQKKPFKAVKKLDTKLHIGYPGKQKWLRPEWT